MAAAGSETEAEAIFLMSHQQSGTEPGAWEVTVTSPRHEAHVSLGVEEVSVSLQDDPCRVSLVISVAVLPLDIMAAAACCTGKWSCSCKCHKLRGCSK